MAPVECRPQPLVTRQAGTALFGTLAFVPLFVQLDVTYRCNERCVHCYLDHDDLGELTFAEIASVLRQLADAAANAASLLN